MIRETPCFWGGSPLLANLMIRYMYPLMKGFVPTLGKEEDRDDDSGAALRQDVEDAYQRAKKYVAAKRELSEKSTKLDEVEKRLAEAKQKLKTKLDSERQK